MLFKATSFRWQTDGDPNYKYEIVSQADNAEIR